VAYLRERSDNSAARWKAGSGVSARTTGVIQQPQRLQEALPELDGGEQVTFADLVLAHHLRQRRLYEAAHSKAYDEVLAELADRAYQKRLRRFQAEYGRIERAYWCTQEISAVAITEQEVRLPWWRLRRTETRRRMHAETDWATRNSPELAHQLHKIDNLAVRADEILRGTSENIVMQLLLAAASHVLSYVDRQDGPPHDPAAIKKVVARSEAELADVRQHYRRAGENSSRIVYAGGMLRGVCLLAGLTAVAGLVLWAAHDFHRHRMPTWTLLATIAAGGLGAAVSVLLRMAKGSFSQDYEVGRKTTRRLAMARPFVGAAFAVMIYLLLKSGLAHFGGLKPKEQTIYFYSAAAFLAGFSERWARVIVGGVIGGDDSNTPASDPPHKSATASDPAGEEHPAPR
jgi:hypothetical protein